MKRLASWLARQKRRGARLPRLDDAVLGRRPIAYVAHRLRFVTLRVALRTVLHIVEVVALAQVFSPRYLGPILLLRHATLLFSSLFWGALEAQRMALRSARRRHDDAEFANVVGRWNAAALVVILGAQLMVAGLWLTLPRDLRGFSIYDAYALACGVRLGLDTWSRTRHSAVFAVARIRRPLMSMVPIDVLEVFGLLIAWLQVGAFAFAIMLVVTGTLRAAMTLWFARSTSEQWLLPKPSRSLWRELTRGGLRKLQLRKAAKFALLNASLQVDSLAIVLLSAGIAGEAGVVLSLSLHAFSPLLGAGFAWTRVFYFDFVRLGASVCPLMVKRFGRLLDRVALIYPVILLALVLPMAAWLVPELLATTPGLLVGLTIARSLFALRQMEAYSYADYRAQLRQGVILLVGVVSMLLFARRIDTMLMGITAGLVLAAFAGRRASITRPAPEPGATLGFEQFVHWLGAQSRPMRLVLLEIDRRMTSVGKVRWALQKRHMPGPSLQPNHHQLLLALPSSMDACELPSRIAVATCGTTAVVRIGELMSSGSEACAQLRAGGPFGDLFDVGSDVIGTHAQGESDREILVIDFAQQFPDGVRLTGTSGNIRRLGAGARRELYAVLSSINAHRPQRRRHPHFVEVAAYKTQGEVTELFLLARSSPRQPEFAAFQQRVARASRLAGLREL